MACCIVKSIIEMRNDFLDLSLKLLLTYIATTSITDITLRINFKRDGAANSRSRYSAVNIITQAVSKQKNTIL